MSTRAFRTGLLNVRAFLVLMENLSFNIYVPTRPAIEKKCHFDLRRQTYKICKFLACAIKINCN